MASFVTAAVTEIHRERAGFQQVMILRDGAEAAEKAYVITQITGRVSVGDAVLANTTAVDLGLGTGGYHVVSTNLSRGAYNTVGGGHIMKLRYTPMQLDTGAAEEHLAMLPVGIDGAVVVACTLHSQVPIVVVAALAARPGLRIAYVMTDGACLPLAFSELVIAMSERGLLAAGTVTAGHAFGGTREAVGIPSALALARHDAGADLVVVGMGPGVVGTGHRLGTTALEAAPILDTTVALGGVGVLCVRASEADARARHAGMSHHSATVLDLVRSSVEVPVTPALADALGPWRDRHHVVEVTGVDGAALIADSGLAVTTMGRGPLEDRLFFNTAAAAGVAAAELVTEEV